MASMFGEASSLLGGTLSEPSASSATLVAVEETPPEEKDAFLLGGLLGGGSLEEKNADEGFGGAWSGSYSTRKW